MANIKTKIDEWEVRDLEDNSITSVYVEHNTEMGNKSVPGIQVHCAGRIVNSEPLHTARWAYAAKKANQTTYLIEGDSWMVYEDNYIKHILVLGDKLRAMIEIKVRSNSKPIIKEYELPFAVESN